MTRKNTKQNLLEAALKLVSEKGYLGATTREIAQEAGVTELTLFRHFGSKEQLFEELLKNCTFLPKLKELLPGLEGLAYTEALEVIATRFLLALKERKAMVKIMYSEVTIYPEKIRYLYNRFVDEMRSTLAGFFELMQKRGIVREFPPETAACVFLWIFLSYFRSEEIMRPGGMKNEETEKQVREIIDIFINGTLRQPEAAYAGRAAYEEV